MNLIASIANALFDNADLLALPRPRVIADIRATYRCGDDTAIKAYSLARVIAHKRSRRITVPTRKTA